MDRMIAGFEVKELDEKSGQLVGYGSTFGNIDDGRDVVERGAFSNTIKEHGAASTMPHMFFSHDHHEPVGEWTGWKQDDTGLLMTGVLWKDKGIQKADQAYLMLKSKGAKGLSIGYGIRDGGAKFDKTRNARVLTDLDIGEVSPTPFPMNRKAVIVSVKSSTAPTLSFKGIDGSFLTKRDMEKALRDAGLSASEAKSFLASGYGALVPAERDAGLDGLIEATTKYQPHRG